MMPEGRDGGGVGCNKAMLLKFILAAVVMRALGYCCFRSSRGLYQQSN